MWRSASVLVVGVGLALAGAAAAPSAASADPTAETCDEARAPDFVPPTGVADDAGTLRVFALQMRQHVRHVETYEDFDTKVRCLFEDQVRDDLATDRPNLVVYPEYAGLATLATGSRGAPARAVAEGPTRGSPDTYQDAPGALQAFGTLAATYADEQAHYRTVMAARQLETDPEAAADPERSFALADPRRMILVATTDTLARAFLEPHARLAREEGVTVVSSTTLPILERSDDAADLAALTDPDLVEAGEEPEDVWVAADARVWNKVLVWSPEPGQTAFSRERFGALPEDDPRANLIHINRKAPITPIEEDFLALSEGDMSEENTGPFEIDGAEGLTFSIANSLPAFAWGTGPTETGEDFGTPLPEGQDPCESPDWWVRCIDARGANVVLQTEANPAPWGAFSDPNENWQPLLWMNSSWRHVADPEVDFAYSVTPWLVGNLVDIPFDGQISIKRRDNPDPGDVRHFVGNAALVEDQDPSYAEPFAGPKDEFVVLGPWVLDDDPDLAPAENRQRLEDRAEAMLAGSGSEHENAYLETAVWADLVPPGPAPDGPRPARPDPGAPEDTPASGPPAGEGRGPAEPEPRQPAGTAPALPATGPPAVTLLGLCALLLGLLSRPRPPRDVPRRTRRRGAPGPDGEPSPRWWTSR
jgi:hypothetical protein